MILLAALLGFIIAGSLGWLYYHQAVGNLESRVEALDVERKVLLDHLAMAGLGAPIFAKLDKSQLSPLPDPEEDEATEALSTKEQEDMWLRQVARNPGKLAARVSSLMRRKYKEQYNPLPAYNETQYKQALSDIEEIEKGAQIQ